MKFIKSNKYLILSLAVIAFIAGLSTFDNKLAPSSDASTYYLLGKALISGEGYVELWKPDSPGEYSFPFVYPLIIAVVQYILPAIKKFPPLFKQVAISKSGPGTCLFQIRRDSVGM